MRMQSVLFMFIIVTLLVAACNTAPTEEPLPTVAQLPTATSSYTPSPTHTPTITPSPTNTPTATFTPTATPTLTFTPSLSPTHTPTFTPTLTPTPTFTETPSVTPTSAQPTILSYSSSIVQARPGDEITLSWATDSDGVEIQELNAQGVALAIYTSTPTGQLVLAIPAGAQDQIIYRLVAKRGGQLATRSIPITISCAASWFFGNEFAPAGSDCPSGPPEILPGAFQPFERGFMVWIGGARNFVVGADSTTNRYMRYANTWDGVTVYPCACGSAPAGFLDPQGIFNWAYNNTLAPIGTWNSAIGWAINNIDQSARQIQFEEGGAFYIETPIGVFRFSGEAAGTWTKIK